MHVNIKKMLEVTRIPEAATLEALGFGVVCDAPTIAQAVFACAAAQRGSKEELAARKRWNQLALAEVEGIDSFDAGLAAYKMTPLAAIMAKLLEFCDTAEKASRAYNAAEAFTNDQLTAYTQWCELSATEIESADSFPTALLAYKQAPGDSPVKWTAFRKALHYCSSPEEAKQLYDKTPPGSQERRDTIERWNFLTHRLIQSADTLEKARHAYETALPLSPEWQLALQEWCKLYKTAVDQVEGLDPAMDLYDASPPDKDAEGYVIRKISTYFEGAS